VLFAVGTVLLSTSVILSATRSSWLFFALLLLGGACHMVAGIKTRCPHCGGYRVRIGRPWKSGGQDCFCVRCKKKIEVS